jgi:hypothetical protein
MAEAVIFKHGLSGYTNHACRCDVCRAGMTGYRRRRYADMRAERAFVESQGRVFIVEGRQHGANTYRNHGCRCEVCVAGRRAQYPGEYQRRRRR